MALNKYKLGDLIQVVDKRNSEEKYTLSNVKGIGLSRIQENVKSNYAYFPILIHEDYGMNRDELYELLALHNIHARKYFYPVVNAFDCYRDKYDVNQTPIALKISKEVLTLPLYAELELEVVDKICDIIVNKK